VTWARHFLSIPAGGSSVIMTACKISSIHIFPPIHTTYGTNMDKGEEGVTCIYNREKKSIME
jgi:hypothetical protein